MAKKTKKTITDIQAAWIAAVTAERDMAKTEEERDMAQKKLRLLNVERDAVEPGVMDQTFERAEEDVEKGARQTVEDEDEGKRAEAIAEMQAEPRVEGNMTPEKKAKLLADPKVQLLRNLATLVEATVQTAEETDKVEVSYYLIAAVEGHCEQVVRIKGLQHRVAIAIEAGNLKDRLFEDEKSKALLDLMRTLNANAGNTVATNHAQTKKEYLDKLMRGEVDQ